ncbi:MAG: hypothetical protein DMD85_11145 [Candidatus Rokuibacteriota bacterium]|nr:MAG: hypothetical protein DMD85_11145 [Candidatus Rokubacteria bacterium]
MRYLQLLLLCVVASGCTYTVNSPAGKVQFVDQKAPVRVAPVISLAATPTVTDPTLKIQVARKVQAPVYEAEETDEVATEVNFDPTRPIAFLFDTLFGEGLRLLTQPERLAGALTGLPWKAGAVTIDIDNAVSRWIVADDAGVVSVNLADEIARLPTYPRDALNVAVSTATATERDEKAFRLDLDTARALYLKGVDMSPHTPGAPPQTGVDVRVDGKLLVVEITNRGAGATAQLRGTLQSPLAELNGREMLFGRIPPGHQRAWFTELPFPEETRYAEIPIRIVFSELNGFAPQDVEATLTVAGSD